MENSSSLLCLAQKDEDFLYSSRSHPAKRAKPLAAGEIRCLEIDEREKERIGKIDGIAV